MSILQADSLRSKQFLLLAHLYARTDQSALAFLRNELIGPTFNVADTLIYAGLPVIGEQVWTILPYDASCQSAVNDDLVSM